MILTISLVFVVTLVYYLLKLNEKYWEKRGVIGPKPKLLVGHLGRCFLFKAQPGEIYTEVYNKYRNASVVGLFRAVTPVLLIRDPDLIKEVTIKSFSHFHDNDINIDKKHDPLFGRNPFCLKGDEWKFVRAQLTPGFTSGKMKWLYPYLEENSKKMVKFIENQPDTTNGKGYEAKALSTRFTLNNVGDSVFGVEAKCFEDEENNEFREIARDFFSPGSWTILLMFIATIFPKITTIFPLRFVPTKVEKKLTDIVYQSLKFRKENNIIRNDFLHIISQLRKSCKDYEFTDIDVAAHAAGFFGDGYETSSMVMSFVLYQLSANQDAQSKLRQEVHKVYEENDNQLPYEVLQSLPYLDAVLNETLRIMPPIYSLQKMCTEDYTFTPKESNRPITIEKGTPIILPIQALQMDPQYFENPELFKPERFVGENKHEVKKCTFMPLGEGPRACLGQRFGFLQVKVGVAYIIKHYELTINKKTKLPLKFDPTMIMATPVGGLWIDFKKILTN